MWLNWHIEHTFSFQSFFKTWNEYYIMTTGYKIVTVTIINDLSWIVLQNRNTYILQVYTVVLV